MDTREVKIKEIQKIANFFINKDVDILYYSFNAKFEYLNNEQKQEAVDSELLRISDKLMLLIRDNPILMEFKHTIDSSNFLWESSFIETLTLDEERKYYAFDKLQYNKELFDKELPYFFSVVDYAVLVRYINYLKKFVREEVLSEPSKPEEPKIKTDKPIQPGNFESKFEYWQIDILTECVNEVRIFNTLITSKTMKNILLCNLKEPLQVAKNKNKLLAYLFYQLDSRSYIVRDWQAVCAKNKLFVSSGKGIILQQGNFSSAVAQNNEFPPKDCHIIDKYIKQLKID